jgi:hypothetical protein
MNTRRLVGALAALALLLLSHQGRAQAARPPGVPDLSDPAVLEGFVPMGYSPFGGDPDFPMLLLANRAEDTPQFLLVLIDARHGRQTWSIREDTPVFYLLFADPGTVQQAFLDQGFALGGPPSGEFLAAGPEGAERLVSQLREGYLGPAA